MTTVNNPLVSCVMPTWNRRLFVPAAIDSFLKQTYENRELVILDDGEEEIKDLIPDDLRIRYFFEDHRRITGDKRNRINELAAGELICHWDDDDWSAPTRIEDQVRRIQQTGKYVTGYSSLYFWNVLSKQSLLYTSSVRGYVCGSTLMYFRDFWKGRPFKKRHSATDNDFVYPVLTRIAYTHEAQHMVARIHGCHHTSRKNGINKKVDREKLPPDFWANEELRIKTR